MRLITVRVEGHYEVYETPFARAYEWHPTYTTLECECGEQLTLTAQSAGIICRCGADHSDIVQDIQEREARLGKEFTHPWQHDAQEREDQPLGDEDSYPEGSPWPYNNS